ncbi:phage portal protein [uncultured Alistipes sp.]|uniref:phage portal protein n=1 Tax=uncultured Alistipes sp. TaxID=538949 RepID=UPI00259A995B|nr:phage portal protein [uncultured Alistipes sp.]
MKFSFEISFGNRNRRTFEAADKSRRGKAFRGAKSTGINNEVSGALVTLRDRARHMVRNNGWARRAIEAITKHTIGEGIQPAPDADLATIQQIKKIWTAWAGRTACDWYGKTTFYGLQELAMRAIAEGGDVLILRHWVMPDQDNPLPLKLQIIEGDQLDHTKNGYNEYGYCRLGVQFDNNGQLIGYWIFEYHPGDSYIFATQVQSKFFPKEDVLHAFEVLRPGQVRGLPFGVAAFMKQSDFSDYEDAQLMKQKVAACFAAFVLGSEDMGMEDDNRGIERLQPGIIEHLGNAESVEFANPPSVADYDAYAGRILQGVAAAYGITYEMLTMDYSKVNFTSGRMAKIDVTTNFKSWQYNMIVPQICAPVWDWFIKACIIAGKLSTPITADWTAPRIQQLDPVRETDAQIKRIQAGLATIGETLREMGRDPEEFFKEYKQDINRLAELGITINSITPAIQNENNNGKAGKE